MTSSWTHEHQRIGPLHLLQGFDKTINEVIGARLRDKMQNDFGIRRRAKNRAVGFQFSPQSVRIDQIAIMGNSQRPAGIVDQ